MRILIDTNIIIPLEEVCGVLDVNYAEFFKIANEYSHQILLHPGSIEDILRDKDETRKATIISKTNKYNKLVHPPIPSDEELERYGLASSKDNDKIDNLMLFAMIRSAAHIFVTEDVKIHKKAKRLGLENKVHYVAQALTFFKEYHRRISVRLPDVSEVPLYCIDYNHPFFDSLRSSYDEFNDWYKGCCESGRTAWLVNGENRTDIAAITIYKDEIDTKPTNNITLNGKSLKLCTFKVGESYRGRKLGELLIKMAFEHAIQNKHEYIYLTVRPGMHDHLRLLFDDFGFQSIGVCAKERDEVIVKKIPQNAPVIDKEISNLAYNKLYHPYYKVADCAKFIVPIVPKYHKILFPEKQYVLQRALFNEPTTPGNTIKKAYLCHAPSNDIKQGDLLLFYRTQDHKAITTLGIVDSFQISNDADEVATLVSKRTVYTKEEIDEKCQKQTKVILFRQLEHLSNNVKLSWLQDNGIDGTIQTIRKIDDNIFNNILQAGGAKFYA